MIRKKIKDPKKTSEIYFYRTFAVSCPKCSKQITAKHFIERLATDLTCPECGWEFRGEVTKQIKKDGRGIIWNKEWIKDQIIEKFDANPDESLSLRKLADKLGVSKSTISASLQELEKEGSVYKGKNNRYFVQQ
ncbi:MAG: GntR family transcriptional regulator [Bacilli bacterium]